MPVILVSDPPVCSYFCRMPSVPTLPRDFQRLISGLPGFPASHFLLSVSGGLDSMVMLDWFIRLRNLHPTVKLSVFHLNHQTRPGENEADEDLVRNVCGGHQIPFFGRTWTRKSTTGNFQNEARKVRLDLLNQISGEVQADWICTAHHADDTAETSLYRLLTGASLINLDPMKPVNGRSLKPLLAYSKPDLHAWAAENGISWREDSSNLGDDYIRNQLRHHLVPVLNSLFGSRWEASLKHLAAESKAASAFLSEAFEDWKKKAVISTDDGWKIEIDLNSLYVESLLVFFLNQTIVTLTGKPFGLKKAGDLKAWLSSGKAASQIHSDWVARRVQGGILLIRKATTPVWTAWHVTVTPAQKPAARQKNSLSVSADRSRVKEPLSVRFRKPGDRFRPLGMNQEQKLSDFFINRKVERTLRDQVPLVTDRDGQIIWVGGYEISDTVKETGQTTEWVHLKLESHEKN